VWVISDRFPYGAGVDRCGDALTIAELDGARPEELVVTAPVSPGDGDYLAVYRWDGADFAEIGRTKALPGSLVALDAADTDGDGRDEIVAIERRSGESGVRVHLYRLAPAAP
jgi:hypothetical protein